MNDGSNYSFPLQTTVPPHAPSQSRTREHINTDTLIACAAGAIQTCQTTEGAFKHSATPFEIIILFLMVGKEGDGPREE